MPAVTNSGSRRRAGFTLPLSAKADQDMRIACRRCFLMLPGIYLGRMFGCSAFHTQYKRCGCLLVALPVYGVVLMARSNVQLHALMQF